MIVWYCVKLPISTTGGGSWRLPICILLNIWYDNKKYWAVLRVFRHFVSDGILERTYGWLLPVTVAFTQLWRVLGACERQWVLGLLEE